MYDSRLTTAVRPEGREDPVVEEMAEELWQIARVAEKGQLQRRLAMRVLQEGRDSQNEVLAYLKQKFPNNPQVQAELENVRRGAHKR